MCKESVKLKSAKDCQGESLFRCWRPKFQKGRKFSEQRNNTIAHLDSAVGVGKEILQRCASTVIDQVSERKTSLM